MDEVAQTGALTGYIDVAQVALYAFWFFFAALLYYLHREDKREGYPLERSGANASRRVRIQGFPAIPRPKVFKLAHGGTVTTPRRAGNELVPDAEPANRLPGAPLTPRGNPMLSGVGPSAYALRAEHPDLTIDGAHRIVPMRVATEFSVEPRDPDPRGMSVYGDDGVAGGIVTDIWVDRSEPQARYLEVQPTGSEHRTLVPIALTKVNASGRRVTVQSILGSQFAQAPGLTSLDRVTLREEDRHSAYFASGNLFATAQRSEPLI
jgi:photosynthetic reaction center H subunit